MQPLPDLTKGLEILEPFLKQHDFSFDTYENFKGASGHFTMAKYKKETKQFILGYDYSIGQVVYQYESLAVSHDFYLDKLGYTFMKKFQEVQTEDKCLSFTNILYDFKFLVDDFFNGECIRLKEIARLQDNIITEYDKKAREGINAGFDKMRIEKARHEFRLKNFSKSLEIYKSVEFENLINDLDKNIIAFCERHVSDYNIK